MLIKRFGKILEVARNVFTTWAMFIFRATTRHRNIWRLREMIKCPICKSNLSRDDDDHLCDPNGRHDRLESEIAELRREIEKRDELLGDVMTMTFMSEDYIEQYNGKWEAYDRENN